MHAGSFSSVAPSLARSGGQFTHNFAGRSNFARSTFAGSSNFAGRNSFAGRNFASQNNLTNRTGNFSGRYSNSIGRNGKWAGRYGDLAGHNGNRYGHHDWDRYFAHDGRGGWGWDGYWPSYGSWGLDSGYPNNYGYYYPNAGDYYYSYAPSNYYAPTNYGDYNAPTDYGTYYAPSDYGDTGVVGQLAMAVPQQPSTSAAPVPTIDEDQQGTGDALQYYSKAREAFLQGDYRGALRLACHAGVEEPQNPKVHELSSLALFALHNYSPAAGEAHAAMSMGKIADWKELCAYYYDAEKYTTRVGVLEVAKYTAQLRALEKAVADNPKSAAEHFLLGYQYLMIGARDNAKTQFAETLKLTPSDKLADSYLQQLQSNSSLTPPQMLSRPQGQSL
jgi:hypothetical protein